MRALGAAYTTAMGEPAARNTVRVYLAGHDGLYADPLEVTDWVADVEVERPLRSGNTARITLHSEDGQFDPVGGDYADAVRARNAEVRIDMGEVLAGVATHWRVMTGTIVKCIPSYDSPVRTVHLYVIDLADLWVGSYTSPAYALRGTTPTNWTAFEVLADLLDRFGGRAYPADFDLDPASDWELPNTLQFEQMSVLDMCAHVLQPKGYRVWFDYWGRLASGLLVPAGAPAAWPVAMTIPRANVDRIDGPSSEVPTHSRVRVIGADSDHAFGRITDDTLWATGSFTGEFTYGFGTSNVATGGDVLDITITPVLFPPDHTWTIDLGIGGPQGEEFRGGGSVISEIRMTTGNVTDFLTAPHIPIGSESYNAVSERQNATVRFQMHRVAGDPLLPIAFEFDVAGHQSEYVEQPVYAQDWDDALIGRYGHLKGEVEAPAAWNWNDADTIAEQEMTIGTLSENQARVLLNRFDLRPEAGDVVTVEDPGGGAFKLWIRQVQHGARPSSGNTQLVGYVIP